MMRHALLTLLLLAAPAAAQEYRAAGCPDVPVEALPAPDLHYRPGSTAGGWPVPPADTAPPVLTQEDIGVVQVVPEIPLTNYLDGADRGQFDASRTGVYPGTVAQDLRTGETYWNDTKIAPLPTLPPCPPQAPSRRFDYSTGN